VRFDRDVIEARLIITSEIKMSDHFLKSFQSNHSRCVQGSTGASARVPTNFSVLVDCRERLAREPLLGLDRAPDYRGGPSSRKERRSTFQIAVKSLAIDPRALP
jgi:hypothetical protein